MTHAGREARAAEAREAYHELCGYTLTHAGSFVHQHVVDAFAAQNADAATKPIGIAFALIGLYLHLERGVSGRDVQRVHMQLGRRKHAWPAFALPADRGRLTAVDVIAAPPGPERDRAIDAWSASVWAAFADSRPAVIALLRQHGIE